MKEAIQIQLNKELIRSEVMRNKVLLLLLVPGFTIGCISFFIMPDQWLSSIATNLQTPRFLAGISLLLILTEIYIFFVFRKVAKEKREFPLIRRHIQNVIEILYPVVTIGGVCLLENDSSYLEAPPFYMLYLFLILSILNLDFYLSLVGGILACISYLAVSLYILEEVGEVSMSQLYSHPIFHVEKAGFLLLCGVIIAIIAKQIRRRISNSFEAEEERSQIKMLFGQQVSPQVMDELLADSAKRGSKRLEVTVMFMDIRNFTPFASTRSPEEIISFQNAVFSPIIEIIHKHGGIINQILGDGFMATFGAPISVKDHSEEALTASLAMVEAIKKLVEAEVIPNTRIGIGLHTGQVVAGNIGNEIRQQYSITGTTVITAARLEQLNKIYNTQIIVSGSTYKLVPSLQSHFKSLGEVQLKGQDEEVAVYGLKD